MFGGDSEEDKTMSAEVKFTCDFCSRTIVAGSTNNECQGFYLKKYPLTTKGRWTLVSSKNDIKGPHICCTCVSGLVNDHEVKLVL